MQQKMETDNVTEHEVQIRPMLCKLNAHTRSDGSALLTQGGTAITATVLGPVEVKMHNLHIDKAYVEVFYRCKSGLPSVTDRLREKILRNTCETALLTVLYPRSAVTIQIHEMEDCGGLIACAANAACLAMLNSGLAMKMLIAGVHCIINGEGELIIDPDREQTEIAQASLTFVFDSVDRNIVAEHTTGKFTIGQYNDALVQCQQASSVVFQFYRNALRKFHKVVEAET